MSTLTTEPVASLLERLFQEAEAGAAALNDLADPALMAMMHSKTDYRELYQRLSAFPLPVSRETGRLLYMLARSGGARSIVEFGASFGISTLHLAAALRDNGGGRLITSEFEPTKVQRATQNLAAAGLLDLVELREGDALQTLRLNLPSAIDLVLLDGAKPLYPEILALLQEHLRPGAMIIADNAEHSPEYLQRVRGAHGGYLSTPFAADVEVSIWLG